MMYPGYYPPPPPPQKPPNGLATGGFVVALIGFILSLIPIVGVISWILAPLGLILSAVGVGTANRRYNSGKGLAIAGVVLGALGIVFCIIYTVALLNNDDFRRGFDEGYNGALSPTPAVLAAAVPGPAR